MTKFKRIIKDEYFYQDRNVSLKFIDVIVVTLRACLVVILFLATLGFRFKIHSNKNGFLKKSLIPTEAFCMEINSQQNIPSVRQDTKRDRKAINSPNIYSQPSFKSQKEQPRRNTTFLVAQEQPDLEQIDNSIVFGSESLEKSQFIMTKNLVNDDVRRIPNINGGSFISEH